MSKQHFVKHIPAKLLQPVTPVEWPYTYQNRIDQSICQIRSVTRMEYVRNLKTISNTFSGWDWEGIGGIKTQGR